MSVSLLTRMVYWQTKSGRGTAKSTLDERRLRRTSNVKPPQGQVLEEAFVEGAMVVYGELGVVL